MTAKDTLRKTLRKARREHVYAQPDNVRALLFHRPPAPLVAALPAQTTIGLYHASDFEAPTAGYARFFKEAGHTIALPAFTERNAPMVFREHSDPWDESDLLEGPFGMMQPDVSAPALVPEIVVVPLIGFTTSGHRLGQGGGHYDRWLAEHPEAKAIGLAWDIQLIEPDNALPIEPHDRSVDAVITPTRIYGQL